MNEPVLVSASPVAADRRRLTVLVGVGLALVLLLLVVPRVLSGGGGGSAEPGAAAVLSTTTTTTAVPVPAVPVAARSGKDPFKPLVTPRAPEKAAPPVVAPPKGKSTARLVDVYLDPTGKATAKLKLDGSDLAVKDGQQFAGSYRVLNLDVAAKCGNFLFGDQPFSLCAGETTSF